MKKAWQVLGGTVAACMIFVLGICVYSWLFGNSPKVVLDPQPIVGTASLETEAVPKTIATTRSPKMWHTGVNPGGNVVTVEPGGLYVQGNYHASGVGSAPDNSAELKQQAEDRARLNEALGVIGTAVGDVRKDLNQSVQSTDRLGEAVIGLQKALEPKAAPEVGK